MSTRKNKLTKEEIRRAFAEGQGAHVPIIMSPSQLGALLGQSVKTVYEWLAKGRLDGAYRKRGKHVLIWRDRVIEILFNAKEWTNDR